MTNKYNDDDYCDIYENKICDNCGKCLEIDGVDIKAIKIEEISKTKDENKILEEEFFNNLKSSLDEDQIEELEQNNLNLKDIYSKFIESKGLNSDEFKLTEETEYEDAFDHIEYLDDNELFNDDNIEELTEEVYPGVRKFKNKA
ncbi:MULTISPECIES: hypothetical protein [Clostridium]|uniref:Uncharacterized protein n=1 Tax=Clostridium aquiflavi TaxID=3073603 RepID=A0ABU1EJG2_9CLOT|nr:MULTISPECIES: hypothetical protein [unclassified Clostridium]MDR5588197.1 hypothetical protein [Clostridium sp. 5N-1]NFG62698.1 hypothetical protein [Clostridium botulinum]NFQ10814.1 hypothetical protein [Clostridium botulinum]